MNLILQDKMYHVICHMWGEMQNSESKSLRINKLTMTNLCRKKVIMPTKQL